MNNKVKILISLMTSLLIIVMQAPSTLGLSYSEFSGSMNGGFGNVSNIDILFSFLWSIGMISAFYWAARRSKIKRQQQIDEAFSRMQARKKRPITPATSPRLKRRPGSEFSKHRSA